MSPPCGNSCSEWVPPPQAQDSPKPELLACRLPVQPQAAWAWLARGACVPRAGTSGWKMEIRSIDTALVRAHRQGAGTALTPPSFALGGDGPRGSVADKVSPAISLRFFSADGGGNDHPWLPAPP